MFVQIAHAAKPVDPRSKRDRVVLEVRVVAGAVVVPAVAVDRNKVRKRKLKI